MLDNSHTRVYGCATWHGKMVLTDIYSITEEVTFVFWWRWWWWCCCWCCTAAAVSAVHNELLPCARQWKDEDVWLLFGSPFLVTIHFTHGNLRFTRMPNAMATANGNWEQQDWENTAVAALGDNGLPGCDCFPCCFGAALVCWRCNRWQIAWNAVVFSSICNTYADVLRARTIIARADNNKGDGIEIRFHCCAASSITRSPSFPFPLPYPFPIISLFTQSAVFA